MENSIVLKRSARTKGYGSCNTHNRIIIFNKELYENDWAIEKEIETF